jgi:predicted O-methyltransferase YrrM
VRARLHSGPWLPADALAFLGELVTPQSRILETGAGGSTLWFAQRAAHVVTFEHHLAWAEKVLAALEAQGIRDRVQINLDPRYIEQGVGSAAGVFNIALIDGRGRVKSVETAIPKLRPGGWLFLDNSLRPKYQPARDLLDGLDWARKEFHGDWYATAWRRPHE